MNEHPRTVRVLVFHMTPKAADFWFDLSNIALVLGAVAVALGTYGSIKMAAVREHFSDLRISQNEADTAKAKAEAAAANERAAKLEKEAAEAKLELHKVQGMASIGLYGAVRGGGMGGLGGPPGT